MWFKTRVGLFSIHEPLEIRIACYPQAKTPFCGVYVRTIKDQDFQYKGIFGSAKASSPSIFVARFLQSGSSEQAIARSMALIEEAIQTEAKICDLSALDDEAAWDGWNLVEWQPRHAS